MYNLKRKGYLTAEEKRSYSDIFAAITLTTHVAEHLDPTIWRGVIIKLRTARTLLLQVRDAMDQEVVDDDQ